MRFNFATAGRIVFGPGSVLGAAPLARSFGQRPLVVTGRNPARAEGLLDQLKAEKLNPSVFSMAGEPTVAGINEGVALARKTKADCVLGYGGGSAIDAGKAIAAMAANPGDLLDYMEVIGAGKPLPHPSLPYIAIPTTSGTGAEVTRNSVIGSPEHRVKASLRSPHMLPKVALVDPDNTRHLPPGITASSGMDALTQLIEPLVSSKANPLTDALCREGILRVARSLRAAFTDGDSSTAREDLALASLFGGLALANSGLGAVHGFAGPLGGMFPAPHGGICAALLPFVMEANLQALRSRAPDSPAEDRYAEVARLLTANPNATPDDGVLWVHTLVRDLQVPSLQSYQITESDLDEVVAKAMNASSMKGNPIELTAGELHGILVKAL